MTVKGAKRKLTAMVAKTAFLPDPKNPRQVLLWFKKELIRLRAALTTVPEKQD
jgi:hypothetical protein